MGHRDPVIDRNSLNPFPQQPQKGQTVLAAGHRNQQVITIIYHLMIVDGLSHQTFQLFFNKTQTPAFPSCGFPA